VAKKRKDNSKNQVGPNSVKVVKALYTEGYKVEIWFSDTTIKTVDFGPFLQKHPHPQHDKYRDTELFKQFKIFPVSQLHKGVIKD